MFGCGARAGPLEMERGEKKDLLGSGGEPNPAGAETWLRVIIQRCRLDAKRWGHPGQTCLTYWMKRPGHGRSTNSLCTDARAHVNKSRKRHSDCQVGLVERFLADLACAQLIYSPYAYFFFPLAIPGPSHLFMEHRSSLMGVRFQSSRLCQCLHK